MRRPALAIPLAILLIAGGCKEVPSGAEGGPSEAHDPACESVADIGDTNAIYDPAGFLDNGGYEFILGAQLKNERDRKRVVNVAILPELKGQSIELVARCLGNRSAAKGEISENDILIVLAPNERRVRIATGTAAEADLTDKEAQKIVDDMTRTFADQRGGRIRYGRGLATGIDAIAAQTGDAS